MIIIKNKSTQIEGSSEYCGAYHKVLEEHEYSIDIVVFNDISTTTPHYHTGFDEIYVVLEGRIEVSTYEPDNNKKRICTLNADELILIGKNVHHQITNTSERNKLMVICNPTYNKDDIHKSGIL